MSQPTSPSNQGKLLKVIGLPTAIILVISSIIGSGVFKKVAPMTEALGSPVYVLLAWLLAGIVTLLGALTVAEIAGVVTGSGGPYAYIRAMYGKTFSFFYGWTTFSVIQSSSIASISYVFAQSLNGVVPLPHLSAEMEQVNLFDTIFPFANIGVKLVAVGLITLLTALNYRGVKQGGLLSSAITGAVVIAIFSIIIMGLTIGGGGMDNITTHASEYPMNSIAEKGILAVMFLAMLKAFWGYEGWISLGFISGEIKEPKRNVPRALLIGVLAVIAIYLLVNFVYLYIMPADAMIAVAKKDNAIAAVEVIRQFLGEGGVWFISILIIVTTLGCTNTTIMTASRVYYAMARNGLFFKSAAYCHPKFNTPSNSLLIQCCWASILVFSGTFDTLTDRLVFANFIFYGSIAFGVFVLRRKMPDAPRPYRVFFLVPVLFILFCMFLVGYTIYNTPVQAGIGLGLIALGLPFYLLWSKNNIYNDDEV